MTKLLFLVATSMLAIAPAHAANLIVNGSFETGDFTGWTQFGDSSLFAVTSDILLGGPTDGVWHAAFVQFDSFNTSGIQQVIATIPGATYRISFDWAYDGKPVNNFTAYWNDDLIQGAGGIDFLIEYRNRTTFKVADGTSATLKFNFQSPREPWLLDAVSVTERGGAVPEPASWAMMIAGFGLIGMAARRRQARAAACR